MEYTHREGRTRQYDCGVCRAPIILPLAEALRFEAHQAIARCSACRRWAEWDGGTE